MSATQLDLAEAWDLLEQRIRPLDTEPVSLAAARGRVLAETVVADRDAPAFDRSAMDGFATRAADIAAAAAASPAVLEVVGESRPGEPFEGDVPTGAAVRIMTGAPVPAGCDVVVPVEMTSGFAGRQVEIRRAVEAGRHIARRGVERRRGETLFGPGRILRACDIGILAAVGRERVLVGKRARVAVIATGDELVPHTQVPGPVQVRNSNSPMLAAWVRPFSETVEILGVARDDPAALEAILAAGSGFDAVLLSGGVSMGRYDFVEKVLAAAGMRFHFRQLNLKPGKPVVFATRSEGVAFGLPGNPVSALTTCRLLVLPALLRLQGRDRVRPRFGSGRAAFAWSRTDPKWVVFPGRLDGSGRVERVRYTGSGDLLAYARANCQIVLPPTLSKVEVGSWVPVWPFREVIV